MEIDTMTSVTVSTTPQTTGLAIDDVVTRLRVRGTDHVYDLVTDRAWTIGSGPDAAIQLDDPSKKTSRLHAQLEFQSGGWIIRNVSTTNRTLHDGEPRSSFAVTPGIEIGVGEVILIAESPRLIALRDYLARLLGWAPERRNVIDDALTAVRYLATMRSALVIAGDGDLVPVVRRLHEHVMTRAAPLIVCEERLPGMPAFEQAVGGTLCIVDHKPPLDLLAILARSKRLEREVRIALCAKTIPSASDSMTALARCSSIEVPPLARRATELDRLILEFAQDAAAELGVETNGFREHELVWLRKIGYASLTDVGETMRRVVAIRNFGITLAGQRLGIHYTALSKWAKRWGIPT
jgi:hypothetical protein